MLYMESTEEDGDTYSETMDKPLVSLATKDTAPFEVVRDHLTAKERYAAITKVKVQGTTGFYDASKKHQPKTFADLYKYKVSTTENVEKTIKAHRKLLQRLFRLIFQMLT